MIVNGHPTVIRESIKWVDLVEQMRRHWNYSDSGYPLLIALYAKLVRYVHKYAISVARTQWFRVTVCTELSGTTFEFLSFVSRLESNYEFYLLLFSYK